MNDRTRYLLLLLLAVLPTVVKAQWNFDIPVVEAYINDHKQQRSLLLARSTLELSNQLLHEYSSDAAVEYKELNIDLDKYTRAFDVIDVLYQSLRTSLNVYSTYDTVSDRIGGLQGSVGRLSGKGIGTGENLSGRHLAYQREPALHTEDYR